jgi:hypothetical protein
VSPPNTTIPKTLAALPSNQYATDLSLVVGNDLFAAFGDMLETSMAIGLCIIVGED